MTKHWQWCQLTCWHMWYQHEHLNSFPQHSRFHSFCANPDYVCLSTAFAYLISFSSFLSLIPVIQDSGHCSDCTSTGFDFRLKQEFLPPERLGASYIYWTVYHLDSWIKRHQLDVTFFIISLFNTQHVSDVNTSILRSLRLICLCGVVSVCRLQPASGYHTTPAKPQRNTNTHRTRAIQPMK